MSFLDDSPPDFSKPEWRELRDVLAGRIYQLGAIEELLLEAGVSPADVAMGGPTRLVWTSALPGG